MLLFENTAGSGNAIGSRFEELAEIRRLAKRVVNFGIGYCIDTCHCLAAGYDVATPAGLRRTVKGIETVLGLSHVPVIHVNDSKGPLGSKRDRHANIGEGHIGLEGFRRILRHPKLRGKAFILETPVDGAFLHHPDLAVALDDGHRCFGWFTIFYQSSGNFPDVCHPHQDNNGTPAFCKQCPVKGRPGFGRVLVAGQDRYL